MVNMFVSVVNFDILVIHLLESKSEVVQLQRSKTHLKWYVKIIKNNVFSRKKGYCAILGSAGIENQCVQKVKRL